MVVTSDIKTFLFDECASLGIDTYIKGNEPLGEITGERIMINVGEVQYGRIWNKCFCNVNIIVPDKNGEADSIRLQELEHLGCSILERKSFMLEDSRCSYVRDSYGTEQDEALRCHFINIRLLFKILNVY